MNRSRCGFSFGLALGFLGIRLYFSVKSRSIGEPLADDPAQRLGSPLFVVNALCYPRIVPEIELRQVAMKMPLAAVLIDARHAALEDREEPFQGIGVGFAAHPFFFLMVHGLMIGVLAGDPTVVSGFVGHDGRLALDLVGQDGADVLRVRPLDMEGPEFSATFNQAENSALMAVTALLLAAFLLADESFVGFHILALAADWGADRRPHGLADAMRHEPRGFEGHPEGAVQLVAADSLLAAAHQEHRLQPEMQRNVAGLENSSDLDGERLPAGVALVGADPGALAGQLAGAVNRPAMRADTTIRPHMSLDNCVSGFFVVKVRGVQNRHDLSPCPLEIGILHGYVKYNIAKTK